jgi:hypothetical protein
MALVPFGAKSMDTLLAWIMFAGVAVAAAAVFFLLGRHGHRKRKARKQAKNQAKRR